MMTALATTNGAAPAVRQNDLSPEILFSLVTKGDVSGLNANQKVAYYETRCKLAGLAPASRPFEYLVLNQKQVLYATRACTDGLTALHSITVELLDHRRDDDNGIYIAQARAKFPGGKFVDDIGVTPIVGLKPADLCNAMMKAITKAKRRAVLSACGLGDLPDETELETMRGPEPPKNDSGYGRGQYASPEQTAAYLDALKGWIAKKNAAWLDYWTHPDTREIEIDREGATAAMKEPLNIHQADGHLLKWCVETGLLDPSIVPEEAKARQLGRYVAIVYHRNKEDQRALGKEMEAYAELQFKRQTEAIGRKFPDLASADQEPREGGDESDDVAEANE